MDDTRISCGCCRGPESDRCCCTNHMDIPAGRPPKVCSRHQPKTMTGTVTSRDAQGFYLVECWIGIGAKRVEWLRPQDMAGATVGDDVELVYVVTPRSGLWRVKGILGKVGS